MKRDIFRRGNRMVHKFGEAEKRDDPLGTRGFTPSFPVFPKASSGPLNIREVGDHCYREAPSAVQKPNGRFATLAGPAPDLAADVGYPVPAGTSKRKR